MLQPVDIAVAFLAAHHAHRGAWAPKLIHEDLGVPWSSLDLSLRRLESAGILRGGRVSRQSLAILLPALQYLVPVPTVEALVPGIPTGASSPGLEGRLVVSTPMVWASEGGPVVGMPVAPLFRKIPEAAEGQSELHRLFGAVDAARTGRARELKLARDVLQELVGLPEVMVA